MSEEQQKILKSLEKKFDKGQIIFREGEETRELYILLEGAVEIMKGNKVIALVRDPDTYLGEMSTLMGVPRTATCIAADKCRMIRVPESKVTYFFGHSPALGLKLAKVLAQRLLEMNIKYQRMLKDTVEDSNAGESMFKQIMSIPNNREFMTLYCQQVGSQMPVKELIARLRLPIKEVNRLIEVFAKAELVKVEKTEIFFMEAKDKNLRLQILNWSPQ